jgi:hypothetical protein
LPFALVLAVVSAMSVLATLFLPAGQRALPALVAPEAIGDANARLRLGFIISLIDALTFAVAAALLSRLPTLRLAPPENVSTSGLNAAAREGLSFLADYLTVRAVTIGLVLITLFVALDNVSPLPVRGSSGSATAGNILPMIRCCSTLRHAPLFGRLFGMAYSAPYAALLITYAAGGVLLQLTTPRIVFVIAGTGMLAAAPLLWMLLLGPLRLTQKIRAALGPRAVRQGHTY